MAAEQATLDKGFDPRPRTRGDVSGTVEQVAALVSIHAPARGATPTSHPSPSMAIVSIHAPARMVSRAVV